MLFSLRSTIVDIVCLIDSSFHIVLINVLYKVVDIISFTFVGYCSINDFATLHGSRYFLYSIDEDMGRMIIALSTSVDISCDLLTVARI